MNIFVWRGSHVLVVNIERTRIAHYQHPRIVSCLSWFTWKTIHCKFCKESCLACLKIGKSVEFITLLPVLQLTMRSLGDAPRPLHRGIGRADRPTRFDWWNHHHLLMHLVMCLLYLFHHLMHVDGRRTSKAWKCESPPFLSWQSVLILPDDAILAEESHGDQNQTTLLEYTSQRGLFSQKEGQFWRVIIKRPWLDQRAFPNSSKRCHKSILLYSV